MAMAITAMLVIATTMRASVNDEVLMSCGHDALDDDGDDRDSNADADAC